MFRVKICGITTIEDALYAADAGADALGLNFYEKSPRSVTAEQGLAIAQAVRSLPEGRRPQLIGVFVNAAPQQLLAMLDKVRLDGLQLHGDEPPETVAMLTAMSNLFSAGSPISGRPVVSIIRAFRCRDAGLAEVSEYLCQCERYRPEEAGDLSTLPHAALLDAYQPGSYGGTGQVVDWNIVRRDRELLMGLPIILAGGLTAENVAAAIAAAQPDAVDTASGVESSVGRKDPAKVTAFVRAAKGAFGQV